MLYRTIVDGEINWVAYKSLCETIPPGRSWEAVGHDRIFAACKKLSGLHYVEYDLAPARYTLKMQAFLPGTGVVLETDVKFVVCAAGCGNFSLLNSACGRWLFGCLSSNFPPNP